MSVRKFFGKSRRQNDEEWRASEASSRLRRAVALETERRLPTFLSQRGDLTMTDQPTLEAPRPEPLPANQETSGELTHEDHEREAIASAAEARARAEATYAKFVRERGELQAKYAEAILTIESMRREIQHLNLIVEAARNDAENYRAQCDEAKAERAEVLVSCANARAILERAGVPLPERRSRRSNGKPAAPAPAAEKPQEEVAQQ